MSDSDWNLDDWKEQVNAADEILRQAWGTIDRDEKAMLLREARRRYLNAGMESTARRVETMMDAIRLRPRCDQ